MRILRAWWKMLANGFELEPVTLQGRSVRLVPLAEQHAEELFLAASDPRIFTYLFVPPFVDATDALDYIDAAVAARDAGRELPFAVLQEPDGRVVGTTRYLDIRPEHRGLEIGWTFYSTDVWRTRVNTECKFLLLEYAFTTLGMQRVQLKTNALNERSRTAILRIGATFEGILRKHAIRAYDGSIRDTAMYSITDDEWPAVRERLAQRLSDD